MGQPREKWTRVTASIISTTGMLVTIVIAAAPGTGQAQTAVSRAASDADAVKLETIVVTAQKRSESPQEIPISIKAISAAELEKMGLKGSDELAKTTTNLSWAPSGGIGNSVGVRGVIDVGYTTNQVGAVGIAVDEVGLSSTVMNSFALFDLERIEVLKGPQTTLYGRSTTGGAVNFVTVRPRVADGTNGNLSLTVGNYGTFNTEAAIGVPLGSNVAARVAVTSLKNDGLLDNLLTGKKTWDTDRMAGRFSVSAQPNRDFDIFASVHAGKDRGKGQPYKSIGLLDPANFALGASGGGLCSRISTVAVPNDACVNMFGTKDNSNYSQNFSDFPNPRNDIDVSGGVLNLAWTLGAVKLTSVTGFEKVAVKHVDDNEGSREDILSLHFDNRTRQVSQELRLASNDDKAALRWLVGAYYMQEKQDGIVAFQISPFSLFNSIAFDQTNTIKSVYGQLDFDLTKQWSVVLGGRYSSETKNGIGENLANFSALPPYGTFLDVATARRLSDPGLYVKVPYGKTWDNSGGKLGLNFKPAKDTLIYGSISKGFKGGTFDFGAFALDATVPTSAATFSAGLRPETLTAYEVGAKTRSADGSLELNGALFKYNIKDQQLFIIQGVAAPQVNAGAATINGAEIDVKWIPAKSWYTQLGIGLLDGKYTNFVPDVGSGLTVNGNPMVQTPKMTLQALVRKDWQLAGGKLSAQLSANYKSSQWFGFRQNYPATLNKEYAIETPEYTTADARLAYSFGAGRYTLAGFVKNMTDKRFFTLVSPLTFAGINQAIMNEPRTYGLTFGAQF